MWWNTLSCAKNAENVTVLGYPSKGIALTKTSRDVQDAMFC